MIEEKLGVPKVNLKTVRHFFLCTSGNETEKGTPKFWEVKIPSELKTENWFSSHWKKDELGSSF